MIEAISKKYVEEGALLNVLREKEQRILSRKGAIDKLKEQERNP